MEGLGDTASSLKVSCSQQGKFCRAHLFQAKPEESCHYSVSKNHGDYR